MEQVAPLFKQGPSALARLFFFAVFALTLLVADTRFEVLQYARSVLGTALYPVQRGVLAPTQWLGGLATYFQSLDRVEAANQQLAREKAELAQTALRAASLETENAHLRNLAGLREGVHAKSVAAEILYDARDPFSRKVIVDRGAGDGVDRGLPVIDESGVVGQVTRVFAMSAEVTLLTDREQAIAVQNLRTSVRGVAYGSAGLIDLRFMPANVDVKKDDLLVTSGLDGVYPQGLPVARVMSVDRNTAFQFAKILCAPLGGIERNRHVLILLIAKTAPRPADEPVEIKKGKRGKPP